jgi:positive regulator of sigma E activity
VCLIFSTTFFWNVFHYNKKWASYDQTFSRIVRVFVKLYNSFSTLSQKRHVLPQYVIENKMCGLLFTTTFVWNVFHYNKKWARYDQTSSRSVRVIVKLYNSYSILSQKRHVLRKKVVEIKMCVLIFSTTVFWDVFHYNKNWARYDQISSRRLRFIVKLYNSFSTLSHKRHVLRRNGTDSKMWSLRSSITFLWNVFQYNKNWARYDQTPSRSVRVIVKLYNSFSTLSQKRHVLRKKGYWK